MSGFRKDFQGGERQLVAATPDAAPGRNADLVTELTRIVEIAYGRGVAEGFERAAHHDVPPRDLPTKGETR